MVASCCAFNCTNRFIKGSGIKFFRFPLKRKELLSKWLKAIRRDNWKPNSTTFICSVHFHESCFRRYCLQARLKEDAVPSIFDFQSHLQKKMHEQQQLPAMKHESMSSMEHFSVNLASSVSEDNTVLPENVHNGQQALTYDVAPSKSLTPDLPTTSASYNLCNVYDETLHVQERMIKCEIVLPTSVTSDLPTTSASSLSDDVQEPERTVAKSQIKYLAVPETSAISVKSKSSTIFHHDDGAEAVGQQSLITYQVLPLTSAGPNFSIDSAISTLTDAEIRSSQQSVTKMHTYAITTSPHLLKLKYEQLLQNERRRCRELHKRLSVAQRCLLRRKVKIDIMKNTIKQLKLNIKQILSVKKDVTTEQQQC